MGSDGSERSRRSHGERAAAAGGAGSGTASGTASGVVWRSIMGRDADGLRDFYGRLLAGRAGAGHPGGRVAEPSRAYGCGPAGPVETPVRDLEAALAFAERLGARVERAPATGDGRASAVVRGPGGAWVALRAAEPGRGSWGV